MARHHSLAVGRCAARSLLIGGAASALAESAHTKWLRRSLRAATGLAILGAAVSTRAAGRNEHTAQYQLVAAWGEYGARDGQFKYPTSIAAPETLGHFKLLSRRWVVERTFAWLDRSRRLSKD